MKFLIDIGSSTVKVYSKIEDVVTKIIERTFCFKDGFSPEKGLSDSSLEEMYSFFDQLSTNYSISRSNTKLFATGIFRDIVDKSAFVDSFYAHTGLFFNIISHELESFYLEKAWIGKYNGDTPVLIINIGGKTTELVVMSTKMKQKRYEIKIGVGVVLKRYPEINNIFSRVSLDFLVNELVNEFPDIDMIKIDTAIYTGGELTYMKLAQYDLVPNDYFKDENHPMMIYVNNYFSKNKEIYSHISLDELRALMPNNPDWMDGARACSAIAQAICVKYGIRRIVPSDSNLIDGVNRFPVRTAVVCGSFNKHMDNIKKLIKLLKKHNINVLSPASTDVVGSEKDFILFKDDKLINNCTWPVERKHINAIVNCDCVIICNYNNYIGYSTAKELGIALLLGKKVIFVEDNEVSQHEDSPIEVGIF